MRVEIPGTYKYRDYKGRGGASLVASAHYSTQEKATTLGPLLPESQEVWACAKINGRFFAGFHSGNWNRDDVNTHAHAEGHIVYHFFKYFDRMVKDGVIAYDKPNSMTLKVTKSPCATQCAPMLIKFVADVNDMLEDAGGGGSFHLRIKAAYLHEGDGVPAAYEALKDLNDVKIPVIQWRVADTLETKDRGLLTKLNQAHEMSYAKETFGGKLPADNRQSIKKRQAKFPDLAWATTQEYKALSSNTMMEKRRAEQNESAEAKAARLWDETQQLKWEQVALMKQLVETNLDIEKKLGIWIAEEPDIRIGLTTMIDHAVEGEDYDMEGEYSMEAMESRASVPQRLSEAEQKLANEGPGRGRINQKKVDALRKEKNAPYQGRLLKPSEAARTRSIRSTRIAQNKEKPEFKSAVTKFGGKIGNINKRREQLLVNIRRNIENGSITGVDLR